MEKEKNKIAKKVMSQNIKENKVNNDGKKEKKVSNIIENSDENEYIVVPSEVKNKNQILNYEKNDAEKNNKIKVDSKIKETVINDISEKQKLKDDYKKIYKERYKDNFTNYGNKKNKKIIIGFIFIILLLLLVFSMIFALININNDNIIKGVKIMNIDVSGLSLEETKDMLNNRINDIMQQNINLKYKDEYSTTIMPEQIDATFNIDDIAYQAFEIGRSGNIFQNNYSILNSLMNSNNLMLSININEETLKNMMYNVSTELPDCVVQSSYYVDGNTLVITSGKAGIIVDQEKIKRLILENIANQISISENNSIDLPVETEQPNSIDIESIYKEIYRPSQDAYCTTDPVAVYPDIYGVDFAISLDEAKNMINTKKDKYEIPLKVLEPKVKIKDLGAEAFPNLLGTFRTNYDNSASNRATNISLAAKSINGIVLLPDESFSYNKIVGDTTPEKGYTLGGTYINGKVVQSYGGGICQVSSTLYNAVVLADLEITMRYNHSSPVGYVKAGRDATVSYGTKDFQFKNSRKYPIKIVATAKNGVLKMEVYGITQEDECEVSMESKVLQTIPYSVTYNYNSNMAKGTQKVTVNGCNGYKSITYKVKKMNGTTISKEVISQDTYNPMNRVIEIGTKE